MRGRFLSTSLPIGLAMFSMFFGAGNIIYPLAIGQYAGDQNIFAMCGLVITAVLLPIAGVIAMILFDGSYRNFFGRLGRRPGLLLALAMIALLGPLGSTPRCIALAYATLHSVFLHLSAPIFSALACGLIFLCTVRKGSLLTLLGCVMTPLLLGSLMLIIIAGIIATPDGSNSADSSAGHMFWYGLNEGYNTMDLLAAFFFSSTVIRTLRGKTEESPEAGHSDHKNYMTVALQASLVALILLTLIYAGFSHIAALHGDNLVLQGKEELLAVITMKIAGPYASILVCTTVALACLTTAIALISAFADFMQKEIFHEKVAYKHILLGALFLTFFVSTYEFTGISAFLWPILQLCYPSLIVLTLLNIVYRLTGFHALRLPVALTFACSCILYFSQ